jgi:hypothetical protein
MRSLVPLGQVLGFTLPPFRTPSEAITLDLDGLALPDLLAQLAGSVDDRCQSRHGTAARRCVGLVQSRGGEWKHQHEYDPHMILSIP